MLRTAVVRKSTDRPTQIHPTWAQQKTKQKTRKKQPQWFKRQTINEGNPNNARATAKWWENYWNSIWLEGASKRHCLHSPSALIAQMGTGTLASLQLPAPALPIPAPVVPQRHPSPHAPVSAVTIPPRLPQHSTTRTPQPAPIISPTISPRCPRHKSTLGHP